HVGILVLDVEAAMREYRDALDLAFVDPVRVRVPRLHESTPVPRESTLDVTITYSRQGPPYYELMGATGDGLYASANVGLHHLGLWAAECKARRAELLARGLLDEPVARAVRVVEVVGDEDAGDPLRAQGPDVLEQRLGGAHCERARRLVEQEQRPLEVNRAGDRDRLFLPARQLPDELLRAVDAR